MLLGVHSEKKRRFSLQEGGHLNTLVPGVFSVKASPTLLRGVQVLVGSLAEIDIVYLWNWEIFLMFPDNNELLLSAGHGYQLRNEVILGKVLLSALICFLSQLRYSAKTANQAFQSQSSISDSLVSLLSVSTAFQ